MFQEIRDDVRELCSHIPASQSSQVPHATNARSVVVPPPPPAPRRSQQRWSSEAAGCTALVRLPMSTIVLSDVSDCVYIRVSCACAYACARAGVCACVCFCVRVCAHVVVRVCVCTFNAQIHSRTQMVVVMMMMRCGTICDVRILTHKNLARIDLS